MKKYHGIEITPPFNFTKVLVGIQGRHYHKPDCPAAHPETRDLPSPTQSDYAAIEVPKILIEKRTSIGYLDRIYAACPMCLFPFLSRKETETSDKTVPNK